MSEKEARQAGPGWVATLAGALLLIIAGFGVGLLAGAASEEPALVADLLTGKTTELPLPEQAPPRVREDAKDAVQPDAAKSVDSAPTAPAAPAVSSAPPSGGFAVQVGAFATGAAADGLTAELKKLGHPAYVADEGGVGARFKVRVGPIASRAEADVLADELKREQRLPTWVLAREAR